MRAELTIRPIVASDDVAMARIIRTVMPEFGADGPGFAIHDPEVDRMSASYSGSGCAYFVVESGNTVLGGAGIAPLDGATTDICELRKMYFLPQLRGQGAGRALMQICLEAARRAGFRKCYLETLTGMETAQQLYRASGFRKIDHAMGATGHFGCNRFYLLDL